VLTHASGNKMIWRWDGADPFGLGSPAEDCTCIAWAREFFKAAALYATGGVYINFMPQDEVDRIPDAYGENYVRLAQVKAKYDPHNLFRSNQNICPAA
jgi:FAD/FMN-containing dehydrogenase